LHHNTRHGKISFCKILTNSHIFYHWLNHTFVNRLIYERTWTEQNRTQFIHLGHQPIKLKNLNLWIHWHPCNNSHTLHYWRSNITNLIKTAFSSFPNCCRVNIRLFITFSFLNDDNKLNLWTVAEVIYILAICFYLTD
jgi:hypothetical protein